MTESETPHRRLVPAIRLPRRDRGVDAFTLFVAAGGVGQRRVGEQTYQIAEELLGLGTAQIDDLVRRGVLEIAPDPRAATLVSADLGTRQFMEMTLAAGRDTGTPR